MRYDKEKAIELRKTGKSYNEIAKELDISKGTLSVWLKNTSVPEGIQKVLYQKRKESRIKNLSLFQEKRIFALKELYKKAEKEAETEFFDFIKNPLFVSGVCIYWGEGDKATPNSFRISNSDPVMIRLFISFLITICKVDQKRIRLGLIIYPDLEEEIIKQEWIRQTGLTKDFFTKTVVIEGKHKTKKLGLGICTVNYSSTYLKKKMLVWIKILGEMGLGDNAGIV